MKFQPFAETSLVSLKVKAQDNRLRVGQTISVRILPAGAIIFFIQVHDSAFLPELAGCFEYYFAQSSARIMSGRKDDSTGS